MNSVIALILFIIAQTIYVLPGQDFKSFFYGPVIKQSLFDKSNEINKYEYLFINTHYDNMLIDNFDEHGFSNGNIVLTDRAKLNDFFKLLSQESIPKYIICDIFFEEPSPYDKELSRNIKRLNNVIIPRKDSLNKTIFDFRYLNLGLGTIVKAGDIFYKYKLFNTSSSGKSIPLKMYEELNDTKYRSFGPLGILDGRLILNDFVPDLDVTNYDIENKEYPYFNLGDILQTDEAFFKTIVKNKIVVIGNYTTDVHSTIYGTIPGSLILLNAFLSLENQINTISFQLILFLWITFFIFSLFVINKENSFRNWLMKIPIIKFILTPLSYFAVFTIISILIYFLFGNDLNLTLITLFFFIERLIIKSDFKLKKMKNKYKRFIETIKNQFSN